MATNNLKQYPTSYGVFTVDSVVDNKMARSFEHGIHPNDTLLQFARKCTTKDSVVVDIGAHIGTFTVPIAEYVQTVIAFEPVEQTLTLLRENVTRNTHNVDIRTVVLGSTAGSASLLVRKEENAGANTLIPGGDIPVTTLDVEVTHADFIKIDVEGMEYEVLMGGTQLLATASPTVFFEVNLSQLRAHGTSPRALQRFFQKHGYDLYLLYHDQNLALVHSLSLLTACIAPGAFIFRTESAPFDIIAISRKKTPPLPTVSFLYALAYALRNNLRVNMSRIQKYSKV
jgi:FkbM family methyltransferase